MRNDVVLVRSNATLRSPSHFRLSEFENEEGLVMVDSSLLESLELTRAALCARHGRDVQIIIKDAVRTKADNERLGARLGWTDEGGLVARDSRHLAKYGGIAVDIVARYSEGNKWVTILQKDLAAACRRYFHFVKADYKDGHVHADNR